MNLLFTDKIDKRSKNLIFYEFILSCFHRMEKYDWGDICKKEGDKNDEQVETAIGIYKIPDHFISKEDPETTICIKNEISDGAIISTVFYPEEN